MNKPPEKVYLQWNDLYWSSITWDGDKINEDDIEYIRADLFTDTQIEVALELSLLVDAIDGKDNDE